MVLSDQGSSHHNPCCSFTHSASICRCPPASHLVNARASSLRLPEEDTMAYPYQTGYPHGAPGGGASYAPPPHAPGYPPQQHHQAAPFAAPYGPPPTGPYGVSHPPPAQGPPPQQQQHQQQLVYLGVPVPSPPPASPSPPPPGFPAAQVVEAIRKATKGFGTDEKKLIEALAPLDAWQMNAVYHTFKSSTGKDLLSELESETSGWFEAALRAKVLGPVGYDVWLVNRAVRGAGTHEDILNEVLLLRTNAEIYALKQAYRARYNKDMERVVQDDLSFKTKRLFTMALQGNRAEDWFPVDPGLVQHDVKELKSAARGAGTDEIKICGILTQRSTPHLRAIAHSYGSSVGSLSKMVSTEFSGHMKDALLYITEAVEGQAPIAVQRDARLLEDSMAGMGTKDERLVYRVMRLHWDRPRFEEVKRCYAHTVHKKGLRHRVEGETSGDYKRMLVAVIGH
ncbi:unnamed protein product [Parajaminaea phylloscopi]